MKKLNKKGFTLAELLVVIAIIAILVAIAVPIFTGALDNAKIARDKANVRSAKGAAITLILTDENADLSAGTWWAEVSFKEDGDVNSPIKITASDETGSNKPAGTDAVTAAEKGSIEYGSSTDESGNSTSTTYIIEITGSDLKAAE